ncbi:MFS general substrate transporter [Polychaeton citri CBS 116435]|uniref:MFS general substrate transporter n=1 Tax=Polychaeton citri CBS 116435 TaxID=1314669 RepID=A0A9P4QAW1_9PEZI|nr:MFS general substrate transporter [Polychaeton citri CBS 116435]
MPKHETNEVSSVNEDRAFGRPSIGHVSYDELEGLSLFEKKCVLINKEMDSNGMGRYQWCIWSLCGFGYLLDLLWAQAFGLILGSLKQELGFAASESGNISVAFSSGLTAGAFIWGVLVDIIGRKWAFNLTCMFSAVFGLALGGCNTYTSFLVVTAFVGFGVGGNIPIDTTITLEFLPQNRRFLLALLSIFQPIGVVVTSGLAYAYIPPYSCHPNFASIDGTPLPSCRAVPAGEACCTKASNMGWRYLVYTLGAITIFIFFLRFGVFRFKESPKFLVYRGHDEQAVAVLEHIAKFNKRQCGLTLADLDGLSSDEDSNTSAAELLGGGAKRMKSSWKEKFMLEMARYKMLFETWPMVWITALVWLTYICDFWGFTLAGYYLPIILAEKNAAIQITLKETYRSYMAIYTPGIVAVMIGALMYRVPSVGRKWTMVISSGLMGASIFIYSTVNSLASNIGLNMMEYFFQSMFNAVLYGWTPEVFPSPIRGTACGLASFWGRLFGIIAPLTAQHVFPKEEEGADPGAYNKVLYLAGGISLGCVLTTALLPNRSIGKDSM